VQRRAILKSGELSAGIEFSEAALRNCNIYQRTQGAVLNPNLELIILWTSIKTFSFHF
jgi:hypothetical protein